MPLFEVFISRSARNTYLIRANSAIEAEDFALDTFEEDQSVDVDTTEVLDEAPYPGIHGDWADYDLTEGK